MHAHTETDRRPGVDHTISQISFGLYLLHERLEENSPQLISSLQNYINDIDKFTSTAGDQLTLMTEEIVDRTAYIKVPLGGDEILEWMLHRKGYRDELLESAVKVDRLVARASRTLKSSVLEAKKGLTALDQLAGYMADLEARWTNANENHVKIYNAVARNVERWQLAFFEIKRKGNVLDEKKAHLKAVTVEMLTKAERALEIQTEKSLRSRSTIIPVTNPTATITTSAAVTTSKAVSSSTQSQKPTRPKQVRSHSYVESTALHASFSAQSPFADYSSFSAEPFFPADPRAPPSPKPVLPQLPFSQPSANSRLRTNVPPSPTISALATPATSCPSSPVSPLSTIGQPRPAIRRKDYRITDGIHPAIRSGTIRIVNSSSSSSSEGSPRDSVLVEIETPQEEIPAFWGAPPTPPAHRSLHTAAASLTTTSSSTRSFSDSLRHLRRHSSPPCFDTRKIKTEISAICYLPSRSLVQQLQEQRQEWRQVESPPPKSKKRKRSSLPAGIKALCCRKPSVRTVLSPSTPLSPPPTKSRKMVFSDPSTSRSYEEPVECRWAELNGSTPIVQFQRGLCDDHDEY